MNLTKKNTKFFNFIINLTVFAILSNFDFYDFGVSNKNNNYTA